MTQINNPYRSHPASLHFEANGLRLHYLDWGENATQQLVLLHGLGSQAHTWDKFANEVYGSFRVVVPDLRGHGDSDHARDGYHLSKFVEDIRALARHLNMDKFDLIGHSLGAMIAIEFASQYPQMVKRLVLEEGGPGLNADIARNATFESYVRPLGFDTDDEAKSWLRDRHPNDDDGQIEQRLEFTMKRNWADKWVSRLDHELIWIMAGSSSVVTTENDSLWEKMSSLPCRTLLVHGEASPLLSEETAQRLVNALPVGELVNIPGVGHSVHSEATSQFKGAVLNFLND